MRKRNQFFMLLAGFGAASGLTLASCNDYTTGQDGEPEGPLMITRLTLFDDHVSRATAIFTDTSAPADCKDPSAAASDRCQNDPTGDNFGVKKSTPTPDSGQDIRIVFNKLPLRLDGKDLQLFSDGSLCKNPEPGKPDIPCPPKILEEFIKSMKPPVKVVLADFAKDLATLSCSNCGGVPEHRVDLRLTGSELSPDPTVFPYGPALQITNLNEDGEVDDPLSALEPDGQYTVTLKAGLSDRSGNKVELTGAAPMLLRFTTEPFKVLQAGLGDVDNDAYVYGNKTASAEVADLANNGVIAIKLNASADPSVFKKDATAKATIGGMNVAVKIGVNQITTDEKTMDKVCDPGNQRTLYIYPATPKQTWGLTPMAGNEVTITITGADIRDVSQAKNHPAGMGKNTLRSDYVIKATLSGKAADDKYTGLFNDPDHKDEKGDPDPIQMVAADDDCPGTMMEADMSMPADMTMAVDGSQG